MFIVFEGHDGVGKTTQVGLLESALKKAGKEVLVVRSPGGSEVSETIRKLALFSEGNSAEFRLGLMHAAREHTYQNVIKPALEKGVIVIADRWLFSGYLYQVIGDGTDVERWKSLEEPLFDELPDITFLLRMDEKERRLLKNQELIANADTPTPQMEQAGVQYEERIANALNSLSLTGAIGEVDEILYSCTNEVIIIDRDKSVYDIAERICNALEEVLGFEEVMS